MLNEVTDALDKAIKALNFTPSFDTGMVDPDNPGRRLSSYKLLIELGTTLKKAQNALNPKKTGDRPLYEIAREIRRDWVDNNGKGCVYFGAEPYLAAMASCGTVNGMYGCDPIDGIVLYFLSNASRWKGPVAQRIKAELNQMVKGVK